MTPAPSVPSVPAGAIDALYAQSDASHWNVSRDVFDNAVRRAVAKLAPAASAGDSGFDVVAAGLHVRDLALALGCANGNGDAWDHFVLTYRPELYRAARAMTDDATGRELADSLYADLFGLSETDGVRTSLFRYYHGRAKLATWLRSVLAQRHVDLVRAQRRTTSLDDPEHPLEARLPVRSPDDTGRAAAMRVAAEAISAALTVLASDDRVRLAYYYAHGLTLAQGGRLFGESEATASRKLEKSRQALRAGIATQLTSRGLGLADVDDWAAVAKDAWNATLVEALGVPAPQGNAAPPFKGKRML